MTKLPSNAQLVQDACATELGISLKRHANVDLPADVLAVIASDTTLPLRSGPMQAAISAARITLRTCSDMVPLSDPDGPVNERGDGASRLAALQAAYRAQSQS